MWHLSSMLSQMGLITSSSCGPVSIIVGCATCVCVCVCVRVSPSRTPVDEWLVMTLTLAH